MDINSLNYFLGSFKLQLVFFLLSIWSLVWKGIALWKSARNSQRNWFVALLILNTFGLLEIYYIFYFSNPKIKETEKS